MPRSSSHSGLLIGLFAVVAGVWPTGARAQDAPPSAEVIQRYEQLLERSPMAGPALDRFLQAEAQGEGLDQLDQRWAGIATQAGTKGATYALLRGLLADHLGRNDDAVRDLTVATTGLPDDYHAWLALGQSQGHQGRWNDAIAAYQKGLAAKVAGDDRLTLFRLLGQAQQSNLDSDGALATWRQMVAEFPTDAFAVEEAGTAELDAEQYDDARITFQQLVKIAEPDSLARVQALIHLAEVDDRQGKTAEAVHGYETILPLTAQGSWLNRQLRAQIEQSFRRNDDLAGLVAYYQRWTKDNSKDVDAWLLLAGTLEELKRMPEALDALRQATVIAPDRHEVRQTFAEQLVAAKQYDEAIAIGTALIADDPTEPRYWVTLGEAQWQMTQPPTAASQKAALDAWSHLAPADSKDVAAIVALAQLEQQHQLGEEALATYRRAIALTPEAADLREQAARVLVGLKRENEAWSMLDDLTAADRATAANYARLAGMDELFARHEAAAAAIQKGLALDPNNFDLLSREWSRLAEAQDWAGAIALFDRLMAAAPDVFLAAQTEMRHLQVLTGAGQLDATAQRLQARLGAEPGLTEAELRLLARILVQQGDPTVTKVFAEAGKRFPQSVSMIQLEADYNRRQGNYEAAAAAYQRLADADPLQKVSWLSTLARVRQDQGNLPEAVKVAAQMIAASPASSAGYLLAAELEFAQGQDKEAVARLKSAIKLSERPNDLRQRLARYYLDTGQAALARTIYDEAFAATDDPAERLTLVRTMTAAWLQDGRADELVARFRSEEKSEEGGGHYATYLATIYAQMNDPAAARRELAKGLAARPHDTALLQALIKLAEQEGDEDDEDNGAEVLRYHEQLAEADGSEANEIALASAYAGQNRPEDVWRVVQANTTDVMKNPLAWKNLILLVTDAPVAGKIRALLETAFTAQGKDNFSGRLALAQFQIMQGDLAGAQTSLWALLATPLPPPAAPVKPPVPAPGANLPPGYPPGYGPNGTQTMSGFQLRLQQAGQSLNEARQLLLTASQPTLAKRGPPRFYGGPAYFGNGNNAPGSTATDPLAVRDIALSTLSLIAVQQKTGEAFLQQLQSRMTADHWSLADRLAAYVIIQAPAPLLQTIEEQAAAPAPDRDLDHFSHDTIINLLANLLRRNPDPVMLARIKAARAALEARLDAEPDFHQEQVLRKVFAAMSDEDQGDFDPFDPNDPFGHADPPVETGGKPDLAAFAEWLKLMNRQQPKDLVQIMDIGTRAGAWDAVRAATADLLALPDLKTKLTNVNQNAELPLVVLPEPPHAGEPAPPGDLSALGLQLFSLSYATTAPGPLSTSSSNQGNNAYARSNSFRSNPYRGQYYNYNSSQFPPDNRYWSGNQTELLQEFWRQVRGLKQLPELYAALDAEIKSTDDWRQHYLVLMKIYFQWWDGKHDDAIAAVRTLLVKEPEDEFRQLLVALLSVEKKYSEALTVLQAIKTPGGAAGMAIQVQQLHLAVLAKNNAASQAIGERLLAVHLPPQQVMMMLEEGSTLAELRTVGLGDKADQLLNSVNQVQSNAGNQSPEDQLSRSLQDAVSHQDETKAVELARQILNRDSTALLNGGGREQELRNLALNALQTFNRLEPFAKDLETKVAADPGSLRLNLAAFEAFNALPHSGQETRSLRPGPHWLKLQRTGTKIEAWISTDGSLWKPAGSVTLAKLAPELLVGLWVPASINGQPATGVFDQIAFTGAVKSAPPPPVLAPPPAAMAPPRTLTIGPAMPVGSAGLRTAQASSSAGRSTAPGPDGEGATKPADLIDRDGVVVAPVGTSGPAPSTKAALAAAAPVVPLAPWQQVDISALNQIVPGTTRLDGAGGALVVTGNVSNNGWGPNSDNGHFVYQSLAGDGTVVVRLGDFLTQPPTTAEPFASNAQQQLDQFGLGVMLRESLAPGSPAVLLSASRGRGLLWQVRTATNKVWTTQAKPESYAGGGLRLTRTGDKITAAYASDGQNWREIFSRRLALGPNALIGLTVNGGAGPPTGWDHVAVQGATPVAGSPTTGDLPAPWSYQDLGSWAQPGHANVSDGHVILTAPGGPAGTNILTSTRSFFGGLVYQPLAAGDGSIAAATIPAKNGAAASALALRASLEPEAVEVQFKINPQGLLALSYHTDDDAKALAFYKKVAALNPDKLEVQRTLTNLLLANEQFPEVEAQMTQQLKTDPDSLDLIINQFSQFERAGQLAGFMTMVEGWTPPPTNGLGGWGNKSLYMLLNLANNLQHTNHLPEAERIYRLALANLPPQQQGHADLIVSVASVLVAENKPGDAAAEVEKWFKTAAPATAAPVLGMENQTAPEGRAALYRSGSGWTGDQVSLRLLALGVETGLGEKLRAAFQPATTAAPPPAPASQEESDRFTALILAVDARDSAYRPELEKLLQDYPTPPSNPKAALNRNFLQYLGGQLARWPAERPMALKVLRRAFDDLGQNDNYARNNYGRQLVALAEKLGDHDTARTVLHKLTADQAADSAQRGDMNNEYQPLLRNLISEGMFTEASDLLKQARTMLEGNGEGDYQTFQLAKMQDDLDFARGEAAPNTLLAGLEPVAAPGGGPDAGLSFFWQMGRGSSSPVSDEEAMRLEEEGQNPSDFNHTWMEGRPARPTPERIEVEGGPDEEHLMPLLTLPNAATQGRAPIHLPPGTRVVRAKLLPAAGAASAPAPATAPGATPVVLVGSSSAGTTSPGAATLAAGPPLYTGEFQFVGTGANLLPNPDFTVRSEVGGKEVPASWSGLNVFEQTEEQGGPLASAIYRSFNPNNLNNNQSELTADRIALQPGADYLFTDWAKGRQMIGFLWLDAAGNKLSSSENYSATDGTGWQEFSLQLARDPASKQGSSSNQNRFILIPDQAAFVQIILRTNNSDLDVAGLSLQQMPAPPP